MLVCKFLEKISNINKTKHTNMYTVTEDAKIQMYVYTGWVQASLSTSF